MTYSKQLTMHSDGRGNFQVGKSTATLSEKGIGEVARNAAPKLELDMGLSQAMRR